MLVLFALTLAAFAGFAAQRGSICAVAAVNDLVLRRDVGRYLAIFEAALWSLATAGVLSFIALRPAVGDHPATLLAAAGGALFGAGAAINGACAFGSAARLARGELDFLFMPAGMLAGAFVLAQMIAAPASATAPAPDSPLLAAALVFFVGWRVLGAADRVRSLTALRAMLAAPRWRPSAAMAAVGVSSTILMAVYAPWPYSTLLVDLGAGAAGPDAPGRSVVALFFVAGAALAAHLGGDFRLRPPRARGSLQKFAGGALMGAGAFVIPGGNDALVLHAMPNLLPYGVIAYAAMTAAIAVFAVAGRERDAPGSGRD